MSADPKHTFSLFQLATPNIDDYAVFSIASFASYAQKHGYDHYVQRTKLIDEMHINWSKIEMLNRAFERVETTHLVLFDADMLVVDPNVPLNHFTGSQPDKHIIMTRDTPIFNRKRPNAGFIIVRRSDEGKKIMAYWLDAARNEGRHLADKHPRNQLVYWNFVEPKFSTHQGLVSNHFARKYFWFTPFLRYKNRFLYHFTNGKVNVRTGQMGKQFLKTGGDSNTLLLVRNALENPSNEPVKMNLP